MDNKDKNMIVTLTDEHLAMIDKIIEEHIIETEWVYDGESSVEVDNATETLRNTAKSVRTYIKGISCGLPVQLTDWPDSERNKINTKF